MAIERRGEVGLDEGGEVVLGFEEGAAGEASDSRLERLERRLERAEGEEQSPEAPEGKREGGEERERGQRETGGESEGRTPKDGSGGGEVTAGGGGRSRRRERLAAAAFPRDASRGSRRRGGRWRSGDRGRPRGGPVVSRGARNPERELRLDNPENRGEPQRRDRAGQPKRRRFGVARRPREGHIGAFAWRNAASPRRGLVAFVVHPSDEEHTQVGSEEFCRVKLRSFDRVSRRYTARRTARRARTDRSVSALAVFVIRCDCARQSPLRSVSVSRAPRFVHALETPSRPRFAPRGAQEARPTRDHRRWRRYGPPTSTAYIRARRRRHDRPRVKGGPTSHPSEPVVISFTAGAGRSYNLPPGTLACRRTSRSSSSQPSSSPRRHVCSFIAVRRRRSRV